MTWSSYFRINSRMVDKLSAGRVFLGGDAAHIHSPAGAQGMNTGIQDAINLAWKLAFVLHGQADPKLLDTYNSDRIPVIRDVLTKTEGLTDAIGDESKLFRSAFSFIAPWVVGHEFVQEKATERMSQLMLNYSESPLSKTSQAVGDIKAGDRIPDLDVLLVGGDGQASSHPKATRLFDVLRTDRFTLLYVNLQDADEAHRAAQQTLGTWRQLLETASVQPQANTAEVFRDIFGKDPGIILVRPDGYAAFTSDADKTDALTAYLGEWFPQTQPGKE